jgi:hypothetical protein
MLKIMERPLVSKQTSFQPGTIPAKLRNSSLSSNKKMSRPGSQTSLKGSNAPTSGIGHASLNKIFRRRASEEIQKQNLKMVNTLLSIKPNVPLATDLKKW